MTRLAIGLGLAAALIPVSLLLGLSTTQSILISIVIGILFTLLATGMSKLIKKP